MSDTPMQSPKVALVSEIEPPAETGKFSRGEATAPFEGKGQIAVRGANALAPVIDIDRLYEAPPGTSSQMIRALELLAQARELLQSARSTDAPMEADRYVQRVHLLLPQLFQYRAIGDGFGLIINSLQYALANREGRPLTPPQINAVWRVIRELRSHPVMSIEEGVHRVSELEDHGFVVDPPFLGELLDVTEDE